MDKIKLTIRSLVYSKMQVDAYIVVLAEENGNRKLPIVIGTYEAQAMAIALDAIKPKRPFTHDLLVNIIKSHNITISEIEITRFEEGIFSAELLCESYLGDIRIDARASDAISLAIRFKCPIYVNNDILERAGIISSDVDYFEDEESYNTETNDESDDFSEFDNSELEEILQDMIKDENYEEASKIRDELNRRKN